MISITSNRNKRVLQQAISLRTLIPKSIPKFNYATCVNQCPYSHNFSNNNDNTTLFSGMLYTRKKRFDGRNCSDKAIRRSMEVLLSHRKFTTGRQETNQTRKEKIKVEPIDADAIINKETDNIMSISVNQADLYNEEIHLTGKPDFTDKSLNYEKSTPLSDQLINLIGVKGPITTADYMQIALTHPEHGYYTTKTKQSLDDDDLFNDDDDDGDIFDENKTSNIDSTTTTTASATSSSSAIIGKHGDFTTSPEISQIFGECLLLFYIYQYRNSLQSPNAIQIVEIGPGKGTLMADIISTATSSFPDFANALSNGGGVHLLELSPTMRQKQRDLLMQLNNNDALGDYKLKFIDSKQESSDLIKGEKKSNTIHKNDKSNDGKKIIRIHWHDDFSMVPSNDIYGKTMPHFILCQEFLDALPIHAFQKHSDGSWRERMVDVDIVKPDSGTTNNKDNTDEYETILLQALPNQPKKPRLRFVLSKSNTPAMDTLLKLTPEQKKKAHVGDVIEVCPSALMLVQDISTRLAQCSGASLVIDYGTTYGNGDTLRGFLQHSQVHPLTLPGTVDVTADVVFGSLKREAEKSGSKNGNTNGVTCLGPSTQGQFLSNFGAVERVISLIDKDETTDEQAEELYTGLERLVSPEEMGERYKILGIVSGANVTAPGFSD